MTLTSQYDLDNVKANQRVKGQRPFCSNVIVRSHSHTH